MPHVQITWVEGRTPEMKRKIAETHYLCANRGRTGKTREHSRVVSRCPGDELRRGGCARGGSKAHAMTRAQ